MISETIGDRHQVKELSRLYNRTFEEKELLITKLMVAPMNSDQKVEAEILLAMKTASLKALDAKIHYLMFGGELLPETEPESIEWNIKRKLRIEFNPVVDFLFQQNKDLNDECRDLNHKLAVIRSEKYWMEKRFKEISTSEHL